MRNTTSPHEFTELLELIEIRHVLLSKQDFSVEEGSDLFQPYELEIGRNQSEYTINEEQLSTSLGFEILGSTEGKKIFSGHFHFQLVFTHCNKGKIEELLVNEIVKNIFLGSQLDKFVWSYLRRSIQQVILDAGFPPVLLPMYH